jgi:hypothetical protein
VQSFLLALDMLDTIAQILWLLIPITPFITIPIVWNMSGQKKIIKILFGLGLALIISTVLFMTGWAICFRNGLGSP